MCFRGPATIRCRWTPRRCWCIRTFLFSRSVSGYLYHPSPPTPLKRAPPEPYGKYSLISSYVVLQHLVAGLDIDLACTDTLPSGRRSAGTLAWQGQTYTLGVLDPKADLPPQAPPHSVPRP